MPQQRRVAPESAMSHTLIKNLPETLSQPLSIATLASLGVHGLFWVILPVLPLDSQSEAAHSPRTVGLVQLTPEEQSRLPQAATPQSTAALPPFGTQPNQLDDLPSLPPPPVYQPYTLPPLPPPPALSYAPLPGNIPNSPPSATLPPPGAFPVPPPPPEQFAQVPTTQFSPGEIPAPPAPNQSFQQAPTPSAPNHTLKLGESLPLKPFKLPPNRSLPTTSGLKPEPFTPENPAEQVAPPNYTQPQIQPQQPQEQQVARANPTSPPQPTTNNSARPDQLPERGKQELLALREKARASKSDRPDAATPTAEATEEQRRQQLAAKLRQQPPQSQPETPPQTAEQQRQQLAAKLRQPQSQPSAGNSTSPQTAQTIAQLNEYEDRLQAVQQAVPQVETKPPIRDKVKTCKQQLNGQAAVFGVVVDQTGEIISGPDFIPKDSAAAIQQAAKEYVNNYQFAKSDRPIDQSFRIEFQYSNDGCPEAAVSQAK